MSYLFTSESVSEGHPDKVADQISDALIDNFLAFDPESKVACETLVTTGQVVLAGEVKSTTYLDVQKIARDVINKIGYTKKNPDERAKQISNATGVIVPMEVEWAFHCYNGFALEQECHHKLEKYRVSNNREFFQMSLEEAKATVEELGERYI